MMPRMINSSNIYPNPARLPQTVLARNPYHGYREMASLMLVGHLVELNNECLVRTQAFARKADAMCIISVFIREPNTRQ